MQKCLRLNTMFYLKSPNNVSSSVWNNFRDPMWVFITEWDKKYIIL